MPSLLDNLSLLEAAQGYTELGLYMQANRELERMSHETRHWPEVLAVKLDIFAGLRLWEMAEIVVVQLAASSRISEIKGPQAPKRQQAPPATAGLGRF